MNQTLNQRTFPSLVLVERNVDNGVTHFLFRGGKSDVFALNVWLDQQAHLQCSDKHPFPSSVMAGFWVLEFNVPTAVQESVGPLIANIEDYAFGGD